MNDPDQSAQNQHNEKQNNETQGSNNPGSKNPGNENQVRDLLSLRFSLVSQLTELNARHIKAETTRSGLEIEIAGHEANLPLVDSNSNKSSALEKLEAEYQQQAELQHSIDTERDEVTKKLDSIAGQLDKIY